MDPITTAIIAALSAGATGGLTETSKTAITDAYNRLNALLAKKFGTNSEVIQAISQLETKTASSGRKETLQKEIATVKADQDEEILAMTKHVLTVAQPQQAGLGKFTIQTNAPVQGLSIGDHNTITQHFGNSPKP